MFWETCFLKTVYPDSWVKVYSIVGVADAISNMSDNKQVLSDQTRMDTPESWKDNLCYSDYKLIISKFNDYLR